MTQTYKEWEEEQRNKVDRENDEYFAWLDELEKESAEHSCFANRDREDTSNGFVCKVCCFDYPF